jgi:hypothetical protein
MAGRFFPAIVLVLLAGIAASPPVLAETGRRILSRRSDRQWRGNRPKWLSSRNDDPCA